MLPDVSIINGDASDTTLLESENLRGSDALVTMTGLDELNMIISLYGRSVGVPHIVTKISHNENSDIVDGLPLGSVICPKELSTNTIVRYVRAMQNQVGAALSVHSIANGQVEALEFRVDSNTPHCGVELRDIHLKRNVLIVCITSKDGPVIANGSSSYEPGDTVVLVTSSDTIIHNLNEMFDD